MGMIAPPDVCATWRGRKAMAALQEDEMLKRGKM
jgi:hypothetical protein